VDLAETFELHADGRTKVVTETRKLENVNECFDDVLAGAVDARLVFDMRRTHIVTATVDLLWIPLGAGQRVVRASAGCSRRCRRCCKGAPAYDLYHSALVVSVPEGRFVIEMAPIPDRSPESRGVVAEGPVGTKWARRLRIFRYEIRRWRNGAIPDEAAAVATVRLSTELDCAQRLLDLVPLVPTPVWGRDELGAGEMWNSNSVTSWLLRRGDVDTSMLAPPRAGRAPGWAAGLFVASDLPRANALVSGRR
jgi:hypothetical protein